MKRRTTISNVKLGLFVLAGGFFLVFSLYMIGRNKNLFGPTFTITANFRTISGLVPGNNVRFSGIDVGTVKQIRIMSDTSVEVVMVIDKKLKGYIKANAVASVGTDGLVGNKIINISSMRGSAVPAEDGSLIKGVAPIETDQMLRTLQTTNENLAVITMNLKEASQRLNGSTSLWNILADTLIVADLKSAALNISIAGENAKHATQDIRLIISDAKDGKGVFSSIFQDTILRQNLESSVLYINRATRRLDSASHGLNGAVTSITDQSGPVGVLLTDTIAAKQLSKTFLNVERGTEQFDENMEAMKHNFLFKGYFKRQEKKKPQKVSPASNE
jgi:phospholipid/cholesterol/gamma-HCH transport system substrate-binding protein